MRRTLTVRGCMAFKPCGAYDEERVTALWAGREALTPREVGALAIPGEDRIWCLLTCFGLSDRTKRMFAAHVAANALHAERKRGREPDVRLWDAVRVAYDYANGNATDEQRAAAWAAAWAAAGAAAWAAARDATWAAGDATWERQCALLVEYAEWEMALEDWEKGRVR